MHKTRTYPRRWLTFFESAPIPEFDWGHWWLAVHGRTAVAFAGLIPSTYISNAGYFCRVGVLKAHCGQSLQLRLMRALESRARHNGWTWLISDTTDNPASANNFIKAGYRLFNPADAWGWPVRCIGENRWRHKQKIGSLRSAAVDANVGSTQQANSVRRKTFDQSLPGGLRHRAFFVLAASDA
jgi:GNAT superfamily N-acetyltransferase